MARTNRASIEYWRKREEAAKQAYIKEEAQYQKAVDEVYRNMLDECQKEINSFYAKYASKEGITIAEAKKRVSQLDIDEYARKAERYVREKNFSEIANEEMALYNLTMKVNRLELLKAKLGAELVGGFDQIDKLTAEALEKRTIDELTRQAGILGESVGNQKDVAKTIVNASFHNATFSEDIWGYQAGLKNSLDTLLQRGLIQGKHPRVLAREIEKAFGSSRYEAERLMRTELARVQTQAAEETFRVNEYDQYIFLPHNDACSVCLGIKEEVYNVADMEIGVNAPPMHPNCRCSIAAYMDREAFDKWLDEFKSKSKDRTIEINSPGSTKSFRASLNSIAKGKAGLDKRRTNILNKVPQSGDAEVFEYGSISNRDLAYISAKTGHEFALFRSKNKDLLVHGDARTCNPSQDWIDEIYDHNYEWIAHTHVDGGPLVPSSGDKATLRNLGQQSSIIIGIDGTEKPFNVNVLDV